MKLREILRSAADFFTPQHGPYHPEPEVIPYLEEKGYKVVHDIWSPYVIGIPVELSIICDSNGKHINALSPKEDTDALKSAYEDAKKEAGLAPSEEKPTGPAPK